MSKVYVIFEGWSEYDGDDYNTLNGCEEGLVCICEREELAKLYLNRWKDGIVNNPPRKYKGVWTVEDNKVEIQYEPDSICDDSRWCRYEEFEILHELKPE